VSSAHFRHDFIAASGRADSLEFVCGDSHSETGAADEDPSFDSAFGNTFGDGNRKVWVIDWLIAMGSIVFDFMTICGEQGDQFAFDLKAPVVAT
jgi:hypothetical protein